MEQWEREMLQRRFEHLGELMGDGEHLEKGGAWISREYRKIAHLLYPEMMGKRAVLRVKRDTTARDNAVAAWCKKHQCKKCGGELLQSRKGAFRVVCQSCNVKYQLKFVNQ